MQTVKDRWGKFTESMLLRWSVANRCRADVRVTRLLSQPERNSPQFQQTSFVSQQHWTTHYSTQMQPQAWNKTSLPYAGLCNFISIVLYNIGAIQGALLSYVNILFFVFWSTDKSGKNVLVTDAFIYQDQPFNRDSLNT